MVLQFPLRGIKWRFGDGMDGRVAGIAPPAAYRGVDVDGVELHRAANASYAFRGVIVAPLPANPSKTKSRRAEQFRIAFQQDCLERAAAFCGATIKMRIRIASGRKVPERLFVASS